MHDLFHIDVGVITSFHNKDCDVKAYWRRGKNSIKIARLWGGQGEIDLARTKQTQQFWYDSKMELAGDGQANQTYFQKFL